MRVLVLDLETVPCPATAQRLWGLDPQAPDVYEQIAATRLAETKDKESMVKPFMQRIVAVGLVGIDLDTQKVKLVADAGTAEAALLSLVETWLLNRPVLVGWNTLGFDLAVLRYRALHHGMPMPRLYSGFKSWEKYDYRFGDQHYDLMDILSGYGRSTNCKLAEIAALCGITSKTEGEGADVLPLWRAVHFDQLRAKVAEDARDTARIFLRWCLTRGKLNSEELATLDAQLVPAARPQLELVAS